MDPKTNRGAKETKRQTFREMARTVEQNEDAEFEIVAYDEIDEDVN